MDESDKDDEDEDDDDDDPVILRSIPSPNLEQ